MQNYQYLIGQCNNHLKRLNYQPILANEPLSKEKCVFGLLSHLKHRRIDYRAINLHNIVDNFFGKEK